MAQRCKPQNKIQRLPIEQAAAIRNGEIRVGLRSISCTHFGQGGVILRFGKETEDFMYNEIRNIGCRIRQLRKGKAITQEQLAEELNVSLDHLAKVETGKRSCSLEVLIDIAAFFGVSLDYLILGKKQSDAVDRVNAAIAELTALKQML